MSPTPALTIRPAAALAAPSSSSSTRREPAVAVVCPFSTGELLAERVKELGLRLVLVFIAPKQDYGVLSTKVEGDAEIFFTGDVAETAALLLDCAYDVQLVVPGAENGVCLADSLAARLGLVHNPLELSSARRSKFLMGETVRAAGVRAAKQTISTEWAPVEAFLRDWSPDPFKIIVKPNASAGSDDVFFCTSLAEVRAAFDCINGAINEFGEVNEGVLVQEFLEGTEYVVDAVSRDGEHKVVAIWKYDKRRVNGQFNVYFGMELCAVTSELEAALVAYNAQVLDALQVSHGPSHAEVMLTRDGPCLVEVGARCHGGHGTWRPIVDAAFGYNQINATLDAFLSPERFAALPPYPAEQRSHGREVFLVSYREGIVRDIPGMARVETMGSYLSKDLAVREGLALYRTIDLFTMPGRVQLMHEDQDQVDRDYRAIHGMLEEGEMFELVAQTKDDEAKADGPAE